MRNTTIERQLTLTAMSVDMHGQLGGNVAENAMSCELSQLSKWNCTNISVLMCTTTVQNFNFI